jgi:hypothetical protein
MIYDWRNRITLAELAPNSHEAAMKWYEWCVQQGIELLVVDGRRTEAEQRDNVRRGVSQTMKSYHLVGQAFDFVPVDSAGRALWNESLYRKEPIASAVRKAKECGFEWGGDWTGGWDCPHMQYNYKGYGTDKALDAPKVLLKSADAEKVTAYISDTYNANPGSPDLGYWHWLANEIRYASGILTPVRALRKDVANTVIASWLVPEWGKASEAGNKPLCIEIGRLADELRYASGQPKQNA